MIPKTERTQLVLGAAAMDRLRAARVAVFGLGGVGGHAAEALARAGVGALDLIDSDRVAESNLNRQIFATAATVGRWKTDAAAERLALAAPDCRVRTVRAFFLPQTADDFDFTQYDYVVDAIDTVTAKLCLIEKAAAAGVPIISAMGTGCKLDPTLLRVSDVYETAGDPLARIMRKELRRRGVRALKCVWSPEPPRRTEEPDPEPTRASDARPYSEDGAPVRADEASPCSEDGAPARDVVDDRVPPPSRRDVPGSTPFVPGAAGLILASVVVKDLCNL